MATETSRRNFIRADFRPSDAVRPFGAMPNDVFSTLCSGCGDCARACPEGIIRKDSNGLAVLDHSKGECTFCGECTTACQTGALTEDQKGAWSWIASVSTNCMAQNGIACRSCEDFCDERAIRFQLLTGGRAIPSIIVESCSGCGACIGACPANAISLTHQPKSPPRMEIVA